MFAKIKDEHGVRYLSGKGRFSHLATISDGKINVEHWRSIEENGACLRVVDTNSGDMIRMEHYPLPGMEVRKLRTDYKVGLDYHPICAGHEGGGQ